MSDWRSERDAALLVLEREANEAVRTEAADALCDLAYEVPAPVRSEFAPAVQRMLVDQQPEVRCAGLALAAEILPAPEAKEVLIRHLEGQPARVRVEAAGRLADLARPDARGALAAALQDESFAVRFEAARGMVALHHAAGLDVLLEALQDGDLRFRAAGALAQLGSKDAIAPLKKAFHGWFLPAFDRTQLAGALAQLGEAEGVEHLFKRAGKTWSMDRAMAIELLGEVRAPGAKERLTAILADKADSCRGAAARALGRLCDPSVTPLLVAALDEPGLTDDVRLDVAEGLLRLGVPDLRAKLEAQHFDDPDSRAELEAMLREPPP